MKKSLSRGFTIVELIVVIVIIALLVSLTAVSYNAIRDRAYDKTVETDLLSIAAAFDAYRGSQGAYPGTSAELHAMDTKVPEASFTFNKDSYDLESGAVTESGKIENIVICSLSSGKYGAAAVAKSGHVMSVTSSDKRSVKTDEVYWSPGINNKCRNLGMTSSDLASSNYVGEFYYSLDAANTNTSQGWGNWRGN